MGFLRRCERLSMKILWPAAAVAAILSCAALAHAAGIVPAKTKVVSFSAAAMKSTSTVTGYCWTASIASGRSDAYRCMTGNAIHDPCFALDGKTVACPVDPASNAGIRVSLTKPLPQAGKQNTHNPWMMQLAGNITCNIGTGTVTPGYPFYCTGNLICAAPAPGAAAAAVFVKCGRQKSAESAGDISSYLVTVMYE